MPRSRPPSFVNPPKRRPPSHMHKNSVLRRRIETQLCIKTWENQLVLLILLRRNLCCCNAVARVTVALLGRFLPRLRPLAIGERPFFFLFSRRAIRPQF